MKNITEEFPCLMSLYEGAVKVYPDHDVRFRLKRDLVVDPEFWMIYEGALSVMDESSLAFIREKLVRYSKKHNKRGWHQFFDALNEARGYKYLYDKGCENIRFIPEGITAPDLEASCMKRRCLLEVKTVHNSDKELEYFERVSMFGPKARNVVQGLTKAFQGKIESTILSATGQLKAYDSGSARLMIYVFVCLDIHVRLSAIRELEEFMSELKEKSMGDVELIYEYY